MAAAAQHAAFRGDATALRAAADRAGGWPHLLATTVDTTAQRTLLHASIHGRYQQLNDPKLNATALSRALDAHDEVLTEMVAESSDALSMWCPVVDA
eukprot:1917592-Prymnesium_polylepis.1